MRKKTIGILLLVGMFLLCVGYFFLSLNATISGSKSDFDLRVTGTILAGLNGLIITSFISGVALVRLNNKTEYNANLFTRRVVAYCADYIITLFIILLVGLFGFGNFGVSLLIFFSYFFALEYSFRTTPGKELMGLRVIVEQKRVPFTAILKRTLTRFIPLELFLIRKKDLKKHVISTVLHDRLGDSYVVIDNLELFDDDHIDTGNSTLRHRQTIVPEPAKANLSPARSETKKFASRSTTYKGKGIMILMGVVAISSLSTALYFHSKYESTKTLHDQILALSDQSLRTKVEKSLVLPDETPTVETITNINKYKDQPFFAKAETGDKILIFKIAKKVVIYRESKNFIINVGPIAATGDEITR